MAKKKQIIKIIPDYRDLPFSDVYDYADKEGLNIDTPENYKEAAQAFLKTLDKKKKPTKKKEQGFSISIKGAGTKQQVIESLRVLIDVIDSIPVKDLIEGIDDESGALVTTTDTFESYTGYPIEDEKQS